MAFTLTSPAFHEGGTIPRRFTCDGDNLSPPLAWSDAPDGTRGFALVMDDPDAPHRTFTHWLLYDIPETTTELSDGSASGKVLRNDFGRPGYGGPCPPAGAGPHRYVFTLHAVDAPSLPLKSVTRQGLERELQNHSLATARLMGRYERNNTRSPSRRWIFSPAHRGAGRGDG